MFKIIIPPEFQNQAQPFAGPVLGPNCLQKLSADNTSSQSGNNIVVLFDKKLFILRVNSLISINANIIAMTEKVVPACLVTNSERNVTEK